MSNIKEQLDAKIPREAISTREAGQGRTLDYVTGFYVIKRLNEVFGPQNWAYDSEVTLIHEGKLERRSGEVFTAHYRAKVRLVVEFPDGKKTEFGDYGYGDGTDRESQGKAHELAIKESITDGLKRCAKNLGMSFGLALYDKTQEFVDDSQEPQSPVPQTVASNGSKSPGEKTRTEETGEAKAPTKARTNGTTAHANGTNNERDHLNKLISAVAKVAIDQRKITKEEAQGFIKEFGVSKKEELTLDQAKTVYNKLKEITHGTSAIQ